MNGSSRGAWAGRAIVVVVLTAATVAGPAATARASDTTTMQCYRSYPYDFDDDGYAQAGAPTVSVEVEPGTGTLNCPAPFVTKAGDCNDDVAAVHPRRREISFNGVDDDCQGGIDETEPIYYQAGFNNTTDGFSMRLRVNDSDVAALGADAEVEVEMHKLGAASVRLARKDAPIQAGYTSSYTTVVIAGLDPATVYRARARFHGPAGERFGAVSDWYYTTTAGWGDTSRARTAILLRGFEEIEDSAEGTVGYMGSAAVDGTRYDASRNEQWCSEFYAWATERHLDGVAGKESYSQLIDYFEADGYYFSTADRGASTLARWAMRAEYLAMDTDGDGKANHSAMFLADEVTDGLTYVWTLDGNTLGNTVAVRRRAASAVTGLGIIASRNLA